MWPISAAHRATMNSALGAKITRLVGDGGPAQGSLDGARRSSVIAPAMLAIVLSVLHLFNIPFGTALGVYGLWALLAPETEMLFRSHQAILASYPPAFPRA